LSLSYLLVRVSAFALNRTKRLIKSAKLYWGDTGRPQLENLVLKDLLAWRDAETDRIEIHYWRTATGDEVDFVIEAGGRLVPIEVRATAHPRLADAAGLRVFRAEYGRLARTGLRLHAGQALEWLAPGSLAVPCWRVL
jgi:predicted AAA+ superfamily ATPase